MESTRTADACGAWRVERLPCREERDSWRAEKAHLLRAEATIAGACHVEDIHKEIEVMTFAFEGEILHYANVPITEDRAAIDIARRYNSVHDGTIIEVVCVVLCIEANESRVRRT